MTWPPSCKTMVRMPQPLVLTRSRERDAEVPTRRGPGMSVPPTALFVGGFWLGVWWNTYQSWPLEAQGTSVLAAIGWLLVVAGMTLFAAGLVTFARARTGIMLQHAATAVVEAGPYRWSRNPQYVAFVAIYIGASLVANSAWPLLLLPVVIGALHALVIAREERYMQRTFPQAYGEYCQRVRRWL